jgi:predicted TPR repeat methyltransferase
VSKSITGVDLSAEMIKLAEKKGVYSSLVTEPIQSYLERADTSFDVIVASDVFSYVGDLSHLFVEV